MEVRRVKEGGCGDLLDFFPFAKPLLVSRRNSCVGDNSPAPARDPTVGRRWTEVEAEDAAAARRERAASAAPRRRMSAMKVPTGRVYRRLGNSAGFAGERRRRRMGRRVSHFRWVLLLLGEKRGMLMGVIGSSRHSPWV